MTKVYLIRHAEAEGNIFRRAHGQYNGLIIGRGYRQIEKLRERFDGISIDAVYSSDLTRTSVTASAIYEPKNLPLIKDERLREVNMGEWEDVAWGDLETREPEMMKYFNNDPVRWSVRGSEQHSKVTLRMTECISEIAARHEGESIALFSHGFAIRSFISGIMGVPSHEVKKVPLCDNTAVALLSYEKGRFTIEYQGDNSHVPIEDSTFARQTWWREEKEQVRENLRFFKYDDACDKEMRKQLHDELNPDNCPEIAVKTVSDFKYTAFLGKEAVGILWTSTAAVNTNDSNDIGIQKGNIDCIYVRPGFRGKNYAIQMVGEAVAQFRRRRIGMISVTVPGDSDAERFFNAYGFKKTGDSYRGDGWQVMENNYKNWDL